ncbi:MAG TPA: HDIG domain-containing protein [Spirochaetota bacterium]|nr:HDIG domain-containing protein [Spirochaetota bacterium]
MNNTLQYPGRDECLAIMKRHCMLPNIIDHSVQVMNVSLAIIGSLRAGVSIDRNLVVSAALLHDITKTKSIQTGELRHDLTGGTLLRSMGYPRIAEIIESHVVFAGFDRDGALEEREIIYYSDKRVMHDRIVSIDERVHDLVERYGTNEKIKKMILDNREFLARIEEKIRSFMTCDIETALANAGLVRP